MKDVRKSITSVLANKWKKPLPIIYNSHVRYLTIIPNTYYSLICGYNKGKPEYRIEYIMQATLDYLTQICLNNPPLIWPARYAFIISIRNDVRLYSLPLDQESDAERKYLKKGPGVFALGFDSLELVYSYGESKRLEKSDQNIEVVIIDKLPALIYKIKKTFCQCFLPAIITAILMLIMHKWYT